MFLNPLLKTYSTLISVAFHIFVAAVTEIFWDKENEVPEKWIESVDKTILAKLPEGTRIQGIFPHGVNYWTRTAEVKTEQADGSALSFFLKVTQNDVGKAMVSGEYLSMRTLHDTLPDVVSEPIAWGTYASNPNIHFFLCSFVHMTGALPNIQTFPAQVAELQQKGLSPNGKHGF